MANSEFSSRADRPRHIQGVPSAFDRVPERPAFTEVKEEEMGEMTRDEIKLYLDTARADARAAAAEVAKGQAELRADLRSGMATVATDIEKLKGDFHQAIATHTKWIAVMIFAALAALTGILGWFKPSPPPTSPQPAPYVIYAQPVQNEAQPMAQPHAAEPAKSK